MDHQYAPLPNPSPSAIFKPLAEGGVLFSTDTEVYFGVNIIGARIWELLPPATRTFDELCAVLAAQYSDVSSAQIQKDVRKFLDDLVENGLVVSAPSNATQDPRISERRTEAS
ncbi:MAG: PqqD family protein [Gemmatimonadaceae bacterium]